MNILGVNFDSGLKSTFSEGLYKEKFPEWVETVLKIREVVLSRNLT
jgi:hypothetical protein